MKAKVFFVLFFILGLPLFAQENGGDAFYIGVAEGADLKSVRIAAMDNLVQQIEVFVSSTGRSVKTEDSSGMHDMFSVQHTSKSNLLLKDVSEKIEKISGGNVRVTKLVAKSTVKELFALRKGMIREYLILAENGLRKQGTVNLGEILKNYYWAFLLSSITPDTLQFTFAYNTEAAPYTSSLITPSIRDAIKHVVSRTTFTPLTKNETMEVSWQYRVQYKNRAADGLKFSYNDGVGSTFGSVKNGTANLTSFFKLTDAADKDFIITPDFAYEDEMDDLLRDARARDSVSGYFDAGTISAKLPSLAEVNPPALPGKAATPKEVKKPIIAPNVIPADTIDLRGSTIQRLLSKKGDSREFMMEVYRLKKENLLITGSRYDFESGKGLYAIVVEENNILGFLAVKNNAYYDMVSDKIVSLKDYSGKKIMWLEVIGN